MSIFSIKHLRAQNWTSLHQWEDSLAYTLSQVLSPPVIAIVGAILVAATHSTALAWIWAAVYVGGAVMVPLAFLLVLLHQGVVTDLHLPSQQERLWPNVVAMVAAWAVWAAMVGGVAPEPLRLLANINLAQTAVLFAITLWWKISLHLMALTALAVLALWLLGALVMPFVLLVPLVAWSRVHLGRHTVGQTVAGMGVGAGLVAACLLLAG